MGRPGRRLMSRRQACAQARMLPSRPRHGSGAIRGRAGVRASPVPSPRAVPTLSLDRPAEISGASLADSSRSRRGCRVCATYLESRDILSTRGCDMPPSPMESAVLPGRLRHGGPCYDFFSRNSSSGSAKDQNPIPDAMAMYCFPPTMYVIAEAFQSWFAWKCHRGCPVW